MTIEHGGEFWPTRIAMLAGLARADALAIVLRPRDASFVTYAAHNVAAECVWDGSVEVGLLGVALAGDPSDGDVTVPLADGRTATPSATASGWAWVSPVSARAPGSRSSCGGRSSATGASPATTRRSRTRSSRRCAPAISSLGSSA